MIFVNYYTENTGYEQVFKTHLKPSLERFQLDSFALPIKDRGNWENNTAYKSEFMLDMLKLFKSDICFLDADAEILQYPELLFNLPNDCDIAAHVLDWYDFWRGEKGGSKHELLSGTLVVKYNLKTLQLVQEWKNRCVANPSKWEQVILHDIIKENPQYKLFELPLSYCNIKKRNGEIKGESVILHFQASRDLKRDNTKDYNVD